MNHTIKARERIQRRSVNDINNNNYPLILTNRLTSPCIHYKPTNDTVLQRVTNILNADFLDRLFGRDDSRINKTALTPVQSIDFITMRINGDVGEFDELVKVIRAKSQINYNREKKWKTKKGGVAVSISMHIVLKGKKYSVLIGRAGWKKVMTLWHPDHDLISHFDSILQGYCHCVQLVEYTFDFMHIAGSLFAPFFSIFKAMFFLKYRGATLRFKKATTKYHNNGRTHRSKGVMEYEKQLNGKSWFRFEIRLKRPILRKMRICSLQDIYRTDINLMVSMFEFRELDVRKFVRFFHKDYANSRYNCEDIIRTFHEISRNEDIVTAFKDIKRFIKGRTCHKVHRFDKRFKGCLKSAFINNEHPECERLV